MADKIVAVTDALFGWQTSLIIIMLLLGSVVKLLRRIVTLLEVQQASTAIKRYSARK